LQEAREPFEEALSSRGERRCERFDVVEPLAAAREPFEESREPFEEALSSRRERRCERFDVVEPLAAAREPFVEVPSSRGERRWESGTQE
jgi:hypothetical protein